MAKSRSIGSIYAELSLRDGKFKAGLKSAAVAMKRFGAQSAKYAAAGLAASTTAATAALAAGTVHTLDQVDALGDLSAQTGVAVADMMVMQRAYKDGGRAAEMAGKDIGKMQKSIVDAASGGKDPFTAIGLSAKELLAMDPAGQFNAIGAAIMRISNPAERTAKAMQIFGKGGMGLATVFEGLPAAEKSLGRMPALAEKFAGAMGEANDLIGHLPIKSDQFFTGFTAGIIGQLLPNLEKIDNYDFTTIGENLGRSLSITLESISDGTVWDLFALEGQKAIASIQTSPAMNGLAAAINALIDGFSADMFNGYSFSESFEKYSKGGIDANTEIIDDLQSKIDGINEGLARKYSAGQAAAAARSNRDPIINPITDLSAKALAEKAGSGIQDRPQANDYQRRGLSLDSSGSGAVAQMKDNNTLLREATQLLKKIADTREPMKY